MGEIASVWSYSLWALADFGLILQDGPYGAGTGIEDLAAGGWMTVESRFSGCFSRSSATAGSGLSAFASSTLTCHISVSESTCLYDGMPERRMPLATFQ